MENELSQWITFELANEIYAVSVLQVQEILRQTEVSPVPGSPKYVLGIINLRGKVITLVDARIKFELPAKELDTNTRIIIIDHNNKNIGLQVDAVREVITLKNSEIEAAPKIGGETKSQYIKGVCNVKENLLILLDLDKFLLDLNFK